jgi:hypothetical protein
MKFLNRHHLLVDFQHGFRTGHSCETQLISTIDDLVTNMDQNTRTGVIILDFSKAFDTVPHRRLINKLKSYRIDNRAIGWIENWLHLRTQTVVLDGERSRPCHVKSGVPQGTVLGPLLFLLYINDIGDSINSSIKLFADDCVLYRQVKDESDCTLLQSDLSKLVDWSEAWLMHFNVKKCVSMAVTRKRTMVRPPKPYNIKNRSLQEVTEAKYLGITVTSDLSWKKHLEEISTKAGNTLALLVNDH